MKNLVLVSVILISLMGLNACKKDDNGTGGNDNFDRKAMLTNYADNYVAPAYADMLQKLDDLETITAQFTGNPDELNLQSLRNSWKTAWLTWQKVDLLEFGPAEDATLRMFMNIYPTSETRINNNISAGAYDLETFGNKDVQGFPALDYLLNGTGNTDAEIVDYFSNGALAGNRRQYLLDIVDKMHSKVQAVQSGWNGYKDQFISATGTDVNSSLSKMVNSFVLYYERYLRSTKIGIPVGAMSGIALMEQTESNYTPELANELALVSLESVEKFYEGVSYDGAADGMGMKDYLAAIGTRDNDKLIADIVSEELDEAQGTLAGLNTSIKDAATSNRPALLNAYDQLQDLVPLFKVDMISAFGISITYVDNDGD